MCRIIIEYLIIYFIPLGAMICKQQSKILKYIAVKKTLGCGIILYLAFNLVLFPNKNPQSFERKSLKLLAVITTRDQRAKGLSNVDLKRRNGKSAV